eukprot:14809801-Alexandrium_andersonii.AAC.1
MSTGPRPRPAVSMCAKVRRYARPNGKRASASAAERSAVLRGSERTWAWKARSVPSAMVGKCPAGESGRASRERRPGRGRDP